MIRSVLCAMLPFAAATAEPIVVRLPEPSTDPFVLSDFDPRLPPASIERFEEFVGSGTYEHFVQVSFDPLACVASDASWVFEAAPGCFAHPAIGEHSYASLTPGAVVDDRFQNWTTLKPGYCAGGWDPWWPILGEYYGTGTCSDCISRGVWSLGEPVPSGVYALPLRYRATDEAEWRYGWAAFLLTRGLVDQNCDPHPDICPPGEEFYDDIALLGAGFESEPGVPAAVGAGLCEADLSPDAVLDLADVQAFVGGFVDQDPVSDLNGDGVLDLADIQRFVASFTTGCGFLSLS